MNRKCLARKTTVQLTPSNILHSVTDSQTDRRQYHANSISYCVQQYDRLKAVKLLVVTKLGGAEDRQWRHKVGERSRLSRYGSYHFRYFRYIRKYHIFEPCLD